MSIGAARCVECVWRLSCASTLMRCFLMSSSLILTASALSMSSSGLMGSKERVSGRARSERATLGSRVDSIAVRQEERIAIPILKRKGGPTI